MKIDQRWMQEPILRIAGMILAGSALLLGHHLLLIARGQSGHEPAITYLFALVIFLCACAGMALMTNGRHPFDRISVSEPWTRQDQTAEDTRHKQP